MELKLLDNIHVLLEPLATLPDLRPDPNVGYVLQDFIVKPKILQLLQEIVLLDIIVYLELQHRLQPSQVKVVLAHRELIVTQHRHGQPFAQLERMATVIHYHLFWTAAFVLLDSSAAVQV